MLLEGTDLGNCSLCVGCVGSLDPLWSGSCIPRGKRLYCWHSAPTSAECPHTETDTGSETAEHVLAVYCSQNNKRLEVIDQQKVHSILLFSFGTIINEQMHSNMGWSWGPYRNIEEIV